MVNIDISIKVRDIDIKITEIEARQLMADLNRIFNNGNSCVTYPYQWTYPSYPFVTYTATNEI